MTTTTTTTNPNLDRIPAELKGRDQWIHWRREHGDKIPYRVDGAGKASSTNPATWSTFDDAIAQGKVRKPTGIGYVFSKDDPFIGIDIDDCRNAETGEIAPWGQAIIDKLDTYAEVSPSKTGVKLWATGELPGDGSGRATCYGSGAVEMYQHGRYFAVTGQSIDGKPIRDVGDVLPELWQEIFGNAVTSASDGELEPDPDCTLTEDEIAELCEYVQTLPPAVSGERGSDATIRAACEIRRRGGYGDVGREILDSYNEICDPAWTSRQLDHKWKSARKLQPPAGAEFDVIETPEAPAPKSWRDAFNVLTSAELDAGKYEYVELIKGVLIAKQNCILAGPTKAYKTMLAADAGISLAAGKPFLGYFKVPEPKRVLFMSGEIGEGGLQEYARRIALARGFDSLADVPNLHWSTSLPRFGDKPNLKLLRDMLGDLQTDVLFLDPLYLAMPGADAGNLMVIGGLLRAMGEICHGLGVTPIFLHHVTKTATRSTDALTISDMAWAGFAEWARQWWTVKPIEDWQAGRCVLRLNVGGSTGVSADVSVSIDEGDPAFRDDPETGKRTPRTWIVGVEPYAVAASDRKAEDKAKADAAKVEANLGRVRSALNDGGVFPAMSKSAIEDKSHVHHRDLPHVLETLLENDQIERIEPDLEYRYVRYRLLPVGVSATSAKVSAGGPGGLALPPAATPIPRRGLAAGGAAGGGDVDELLAAGAWL